MTDLAGITARLKAKNVELQVLAMVSYPFSKWSAISD
jgi:hypothetical protein